MLKFIFPKLIDDIDAIRQRDPAARSRWEVLTCYPGLHAVLWHRLSHAFWIMHLKWIGRFTSHIGRMLTGIEIHPGATIGRRVFIDHGLGVVIGETAEIGDDCTIYQGVTLGGTSLYKGVKRHPTLGKGVVVSAGAKVLGGFALGDGSRVGSNAVVLKEVPAGATAVGIPARIILPEQREGTAVNKADPKVEFSAYGITSQAEDPVAQSIKSLLAKTEEQAEEIAKLKEALERFYKNSETH